MSILYVDTSVVAALLFAEKNYKDVNKRLNQADRIVSSHLMIAKREDISFDDIDQYLQYFDIAVPDRTLQAEVISILEQTYCRGADAFHIATAIYLDPKMEKLKFYSFDKQQLVAAKNIGLKTLSD